MPKNKGKGGKNRRRGKNENEDLKRELIKKTEGQAYAKVERMLGNGRLYATCFEDGKQRLCHIRGKLRKKIWVNQGDVVLLGLREFQDLKADVLFKYTNEEARQLKQLEEIPENVNLEQEGDAALASAEIQFADMELSESEPEPEESESDESEDESPARARFSNANNPNRAGGGLKGKAARDRDRDREAGEDSLPSNPNRKIVDRFEMPPSESEEEEEEPSPGANSASQKEQSARAGAAAKDGEEQGGGLYSGMAESGKRNIKEKTRTGRMLSEKQARSGRKQQLEASGADLDGI